MEDNYDNNAANGGMDQGAATPPNDPAPQEASASSPSDKSGMFFDGRDDPGLMPTDQAPTSSILPGQRATVEFDFKSFALNPLVEACSGLLALFVRLQTLETLNEPHVLRARVADEIRRIEAELQDLSYITEVDDLGNVTGRRYGHFAELNEQRGYGQSGVRLYDYPIVNALRYCLCTMIDEGVMANRNAAIGDNSAWRQESLLAEFHNETWGGEKVFLIKDRLIREPEQYQDFLEFLFLMFTLGYRGKYRVAHSGNERFERVVNELHGVIRELRGEVDQELTTPLANRNHVPEHVRPTLPPGLVVLFFLAVIVGLFAFFWLRVESQTNDVLLQLDALLATQTDNSTVTTRSQ